MSLLVPRELLLREPGEGPAYVDFIDEVLLRLFGLQSADARREYEVLDSMRLAATRSQREVTEALREIHRQVRRDPYRQFERSGALVATICNLATLLLRGNNLAAAEILGKELDRYADHAPLPPDLIAAAFRVRAMIYIHLGQASSADDTLAYDSSRGLGQKLALASLLSLRGDEEAARGVTYDVLLDAWQQNLRGLPHAVELIQQLGRRRGRFYRWKYTHSN